MTDLTKKFYVTTPIYYVTAKPHLGSLYSTLLADVAARWFKLRGRNVFFLTGTDEHGQKVAAAALKAGKEPKAFVDSFIDAFKDTWHKFHIDYTKFIRTTDEYHVKGVQLWLQQLQASGDIYKAVYKGWYCTPCETFITDKELPTAALGSDNAKEGGMQAMPVCGSCARPTEFLEEESYFFRLSAYQDRLLKFYEQNPHFIVPPERRHEVINFVQSGLRDLSISRTTITWGIPFPGDIKHVTYVWADALNNYITGVGFGDSAKSKEFNYWWPADLQVMGKDIVRFHAIYWPAFLMASKLALPQCLLVHGWLKVNNQKMSKSFGNVVDPQDLLAIYGADVVRYYLVRYMAITHDAEFSTADLEQRVSADLANDLGNLLNRLVMLAHKFSIYEAHPPDEWNGKEKELQEHFYVMLQAFIKDMESYYFYKAYGHLWKFINQVNAYFHEQEPWKKGLTETTHFKVILSATAHALNAIATLALPVMPEKMTELLKSLSIEIDHTSGVDTIKNLTMTGWSRVFVFQKIPPLFTKYETRKETPMENKQQSNQSAELANDITIEDLKKVELVVGTIISCEPIEKSDKLWKLQVDFGPKGLRQILSGIKQFYSAQELIGKQAVFVYNLQPRSMMGNESQGMILLPSNAQNKPVLISLQEPVPNGTRLK